MLGHMSPPRRGPWVKPLVVPATIREHAVPPGQPAPPLFPERTNSLSKRRAAAAAAAAANPQKARADVRGPPGPNFRTLIEGCDIAEVAAQMKISPEALEEITANKNPIVERWAPVLAKCTRMVRVGLLRLLNRDYEEDNNPTIGETISRKLNQCGRSVIDRTRAALSTGWTGWKYTLDETTIENFLAGRSAEAEHAAQLLLRLANATDKTNIYGIFVVARGSQTNHH